MKSQPTPAAAESPEGVIQFAFRLNPPVPGDVLPGNCFAELAAWRAILKRLKLIGRDKRRYDGHAYGNVSLRDPTAANRFFVTASQTSGAPRLLRRDMVRIDSWDATAFAVAATGLAAPSSESITHAMIYAADPGIHWIMHVHCDAIWNIAAQLQLPATGADVPYGSSAMAGAVAGLLQRHAQRPALFTTRGHTDGVFAAGGDAASTAGALLGIFARALAYRS